MYRYVAPSINETAFNCPHCGALAKQSWFELRCSYKKKDGLPLRITEQNVNRSFLDEIEDQDECVKWTIWLEKMIQDAPFIEQREAEYFGNFNLYMIELSQCFNCDNISVWVQSNLVYPVRGDVPVANPDLPNDIRLDYEEAGRIWRVSPRGAAALLRLAIQKLCIILGGSGKSIDADIAQLVQQGLDVRIQQSLDIVRVIGNEAVHPGQIDLRDDPATAENLFTLINIIADALITQPKQISEMYAKLPQSKRDGIATRDRNLKN